MLFGFTMFEKKHRIFESAFLLLGKFCKKRSPRFVFLYKVDVHHNKFSAILFRFVISCVLGRGKHRAISSMPSGLDNKAKDHLDSRL